MSFLAMHRFVTWIYIQPFQAQNTRAFKARICNSRINF